MFAFIPLGFHFGGLLGAVIGVAAGDFPFYVVLTYGVEKQKVSVWRQDALTTVMFLGFLAAGYFLKHLIA